MGIAILAQSCDNGLIFHRVVRSFFGEGEEITDKCIVCMNECDSDFCHIILWAFLSLKASMS